MPDKISILKESGETINSNVVSVFMIPDTEKKYIITTENAVDPHGLTVLHVSEIVDGNLQKIATDEEWSSIKTIMRAMISGNVSSYQYLPTVENINASGQYSRDISVSASASKQMIDNYLVGKKSNVVVDAQTAPTVDAVNPSEGNANVNQAAIFPSGNGVAANADDELIPGIAEVDAAPVDPSVLQGTVPTMDNQMMNNNINPVVPGVPGMDNNVNPLNLGVPGMDNNVLAQGVPPVPNVNGVVGVDPVIQPSLGQVPGAPMQSLVSNAANPLNGVPNQPIAIQPIITGNPVDNNVLGGAIPPIMPGMPDNTLMNNEVQVPSIPGMPPLTDNVNTVTATNDQVNNNLIQTPPVLVNTDADQGIIPEVPTLVPDAPLTPDVQVLQPGVVVPTGQIAQEAQASVSVPDVKIDTSVAPSFAPDASLDEVVVAAQEMFMEGVKNLVQTIQEKVYRDLYARENAVKEKETLLEQREKMLNEQMMAMMSNFAAMQGKAMTPLINTDTK